MLSIWKFEIPMHEGAEIMMPEGAEVLTVQAQRGEPFLWARVNPDAPKIKRLFAVHGTGHPIPDDGRKHLGSFQLHGGSLVFHVFERLA